MDSVRERLERVHERIAAACARAGRAASDITLVAVTKYATFGDGVIESLIALGCRDLGESRPQQLAARATEPTLCQVTPPIRWHQIGLLQRNKIRKVLPLTALIHSVDSISLAEAIDRVASEESIACVPVLIEINVSNDATKGGFDTGTTSSNVEAAWERLLGLSHLEIQGVMGMSGLDATLGDARREFAMLRELQERLARRTGRPLPTLSMGMSDDFEIAIEEGSTMLRIGSVLYPNNKA